nr:hypothetical protein TorRG33x02_278400 [Ipomoea batatas]
MRAINLSQRKLNLCRCVGILDDKISYMEVHPAVYILSVAPSTTQPLRYPPELKSEKQTVFPGRKLELEVAIHFEPPNLLKICYCLESTLWEGVFCALGFGSEGGSDEDFE